MIGNSLLSQVIVAGLAIGIIITYIQPTITQISSRQDEINQTREELEKINSVNERLDQLVAQTNNISQRDINALETYMPDELDNVQVLKDIYSITQLAGVVTESLVYSGEGPDLTLDDPSAPFTHLFSISVDGSYERIKQMLVLMEQNNYPLDVKSLTITPNENGFIKAVLEVVTYSHK